MARMLWTTDTLANCTATLALLDKLFAYPAKPDVIGAKCSALVASSWDGTGNAPFGWTKTYGYVRQHPTLPQYAIPLDDDVGVALNDPTKTSRLTAGELATLQAKYTARAALAAAWDPVASVT